MENSEAIALTIEKITHKLEQKFPHRQLAIHCVEVVKTSPNAASTIRFCTHDEKVELHLVKGKDWNDLPEEWWEQWKAFVPANSLLRIGLSLFVNAKIKEFKTEGTMLKEVICKEENGDRLFRIVPHPADNRFLDMQGVVRMCG